MYGIAYVFLPVNLASLQRGLDEALAPFRRGGIGEFPRDKLAFDDVTGQLRKLHREPITLTAEDDRVFVHNTDTAMVIDLDFVGLREFMQTGDADRWSGRLVDVEPDFNAFVLRFTKWKQCDP